VHFHNKQFAVKKVLSVTQASSKGVRNVVEKRGSVAQASSSKGSSRDTKAQSVRAPRHLIARTFSRLTVGAPRRLLAGTSRRLTVGAPRCSIAGTSRHLTVGAARHVIIGTIRLNQ